MHQLDIIVLLKKVSSQEIKSFHTHLKRRFQAGSIPIKLFRFLRNHYPVFDPNKVTYEKAHEYVFPKKKFKKVSVSNSLSDIHIELKKYLVEQHLQEASFSRNFILLQIYEKYGLSKLFNKQIKTLELELTKRNKSDLWMDLRTLLINHKAYFVGTNQVKNYDAINGAMANLDRFYAAAKLTYATEIINRSKILNEEEADILFLSELERIDWKDQSVYYDFYRMAYQLAKTRHTDYYHQLRNHFFEKSNQLPKRDQYIIFTYLMNHTSYKIQKGKDQFIKEAFKLIQFGVVRELFIVDGIFLPVHFLNAIEIASNLKHYSWCKNLIAKWSNKLAGDTREYYISIALAIIYFKMKNYDACSDTLRDINLREPQDQYRGKWLHIVSLYEIGSADELIKYQCNAFEKFIRSNKYISTDKKEGVLLSIKILRMLLKPEPNKAKMNQLLTAANNYYYKSWLEQKIQKL